MSRAQVVVGAVPATAPTESLGQVRGSRGRGWGEFGAAAEVSGMGAHLAQPLTALLAASFRRAEEEDEHLERTLEQNKGKMAKKEEKCVLQ